MLYFLALPRCATPTRCEVFYTVQNHFYLLASIVRLPRLLDNAALQVGCTCTWPNLMRPSKIQALKSKLSGL